jgi:16S rRNA C967 or C1407 C5-methylase (RsmB/RsmF family)
LLFELEATQRGLLEHAVSLLDPDNPHAEVWYMTCSILKREDEVRVPTKSIQIKFRYSRSTLGVIDAH